MGGFDPAGVGSGGVQVDHRARGRLGALSPSEQLSDGWALTLLIVRRAARTAILRLGRSMRSTMGVASSESSLGEAISDPTILSLSAEFSQDQTLRECMGELGGRYM